MKPTFLPQFLGLLLLALSASPAHADGNPQSAITAEDIEPTAFAAWLDGSIVATGLPKKGAIDVLWTKNSRPDWPGATFGESAAPGARHLRIGFKTPVAIGSVLVRGGGQLAVLKANAEFPGDPGRESDWLPAERLKDAQISTAEVQRKELAVWVLPPGTTTRALRFTHVAQAADPKYGGWLGGALLLAERCVNSAPDALVIASTRDEIGGRISNEQDEGWDTWENGRDGAAVPVSAEHAEWVTLVWPQPVTLRGLETIWTGFSAAEVQIFAGAAGRHPREATDAEWRPLKSFGKLENGYPLSFWPNGLDFDQPVTTRAVRLRMTATTSEGHDHLKGRTKAGKRVWLGELMALRPLGNAPLQTALPAAKTSDAHPPIPVRFHLAEPGVVTLVIEDSAGKRVRNLVAETSFPAGDNIAWWDGTDDLGRDHDAARHGLYHIPEQPVAPGAYRVRGLVHQGLDLRYEFSIYNAGNPAWETEDKSGGWLTNHTPPQSALFVPADKSPNQQPMVYLGSAVSEGGAGLAWVDLDGKKIGGRGWIGGNWTAAPTLARDAGKDAVPDVFAYVGAAWSATSSNQEKTRGELRLTALTAKGDKPVLKHPITAPPRANKGANSDEDWVSQLGGIAVQDGLLVASLTKLNSLLLVDARAGKALGEIPIDDPRGVAFEPNGRLLVLAGTKLLRLQLDPAAPTKPVATQTLVPALDDPHGLTLDADGSIFVSEHGGSQQVKVFSPEGKLLRAIGHAGAPKAGVYDPLHMNHPHGLAIDAKRQLWVTENDFQPKRVSVWTLDGKLVRAAYGPGRYGGGGTLDPRDKSRFYYDGIEFKLDWKTAENTPVAVFSRGGEDDFSSQSGAGAPETPIYVGERQYLTNCFNSNPTGGVGLASIWRLKDHLAKPVAACGRAQEWKLLKGADFAARWPEGVDPRGDSGRNPAFFIWSDANGDGRVQPDEVTMRKGESGGITVAPDLSFLVARWEKKAMRFAPASSTAEGVPIYNLEAGEVLAEGAQSPPSSGGDQTLLTSDGWTLLTNAPKPWAPEGFGGVKNGQPIWSYPSLWPGLHASHEAPVPDRAGEVIGTTRLLGPAITPPPPSDAGPLWAINGNMGNIYVFTVDGLFVGRLFDDSRTGKPWVMPAAQRGMKLNGLTLHDENFFPSVAQTSDGLVYLCDGARTSLVRVDGLEKIRRLPATELWITAADLQAAAAWRVQAEALRQAARGSGTLTVELRNSAPVVDGQLDDWANADWAVIDRRGTAANFDSDTKPYDLTCAVAIAGDRLFAAFRTQDADLLKNSGETPNAPFKTGGCLDLMIGANAAADPKRPRPVAGDQRLLVTQVQGKTRALLYRAIVSGTREPVPFSSPWRTITIDRVDDVSGDVQLAVSVGKNERGRVKEAFYEFSIPLAALGLQPADGASIKADLGILRGNGFQTLQRVYWNNKATAITADVPSEAELTPALWGKWQFKSAP